MILFATTLFRTGQICSRRFAISSTWTLPPSPFTPETNSKNVRLVWAGESCAAARQTTLAISWARNVLLAAILIYDAPDAVNVRFHIVVTFNERHRVADLTIDLPRTVTE